MAKNSIQLRFTHQKWVNDINFAHLKEFSDVSIAPVNPRPLFRVCYDSLPLISYLTSTAEQPLLLTFI